MLIVKNQNRSKQLVSKWKGMIMAFFLAIAGLLFLLPPTTYATETVINGCMQDVTDFGLVCTANDVSLSEVAEDDIVVTDRCEFPGDMVTFTATFTTVLTAKERHDIGIYFELGEDLNNDGARTGTCSISTVDFDDDPPWLDLDGTLDTYVDTNIVSNIQDTCGDIDADHNPLRPVIEITTECIDRDGDGFLDLPYCTSWRQPGSNDLCTGPRAEEVGGTGSELWSSGVTPGAPSKCKCDPGFFVPVPVPSAELEITKTVVPTSMDEPGGPATFTLLISNPALDPLNNVTVESLNDDRFGDLLAEEITGNELLLTNDCDNNVNIITAGGSQECTFSAYVAGDFGIPHIDTVTVFGLDERDPPNELEASDDATVTFNDVLPVIVVDKTANPTAVDEPGGPVTFTYVVENHSVEPVVITSLSDNIFGTLAGDTDCQLGTWLPVDGHCSFVTTQTISGNAGFIHINEFTAVAEDNEGNLASDMDPAQVQINDVGSSIDVDKIADPEVVSEPGDDVEFYVTIDNTSLVDTVTINSLVDDIHGDLDGQGSCLVPQDILPGGSYNCSFSAYVAGNAGDSEEDTVTASGFDDDGFPVEDSDPALVTIEDVLPAASITKTVKQMLVTYEVRVFNDSEAEALQLDALTDDKFGDLHDKGDCKATGQDIAIGGSYTCKFDAIVISSPHTNTVTATVSDDDGEGDGNVVTPAPEASATVTADLLIP